MRTNGSVYVAVVEALLVGYFSYQWWFNPRRAIKRQLGELAATLSVPPGGAGEMDRLARVARLRNYFAPDVQISTGRGQSITSRDTLIAMVGAWKPPDPGWNVTFVDVQIALDPGGTTAGAYMTVEITGEDPGSGQPSLDAREVMVRLAEQSDAWVITTAEPLETLQRP